jgi:hypothetical protein
MLKDIELFLSAGKTRGSNDMNNKIREDILVILLHPPEDYLLDETYGKHWVDMATKWQEFLHKLCDKEFDDITIKKIANRKQFDLEINYLKNKETIYQVLGEFKHNCKSISKLPQYYSAAENKNYVPLSYTNYFYDNYLDKICELVKLEKLNKETYLKHIYQHNYAVNEFFVKLKESEKDFYNQKKSIVHDSIKTYLTTYGNQIIIKNFQEDITRQQTKTFILWDCKQFYADRIRPDELEIEKFETIKNNNTIVLISKAGTRHKMLLRWRNHLGVLYPAWQVSLER